MKIEGSCHCGAVRFRAETETPTPYMRCYCSICRKTAGGGGYAVNIMAIASTLEVEGEENVSIYQVRIPAQDGNEEPDTSPAQRRFCKRCGSCLWIFDPRWEESIYPFASAIDTPLPTPPTHTHIMLDYAAEWAKPRPEAKDKSFPGYPEESIADWHQKRIADEEG